MARTSKAIVKDLLREANYYWHDDNEDNVNPLNPDDYDPVVDMLFKANAVELEKLYSEIDESRNEVTLSLSKALVPEQSLLPEPGYTVAQIKSRASRVHTSPADNFHINGQSDTGESYEYYFTPLFEHEYPNCDLVAILTENLAMQVEDNVPEIMKEIRGGKSGSHVWLGLDISKIKEKDKVSFFLGNKIVDAFDKDYHVFHQAKWLVNGDAGMQLEVQTGIDSFSTVKSTRKYEHLLDEIDVPNSYEKQIFSRLRTGFINIAFPDNIEKMKYRVPPLFDGSELTSTLSIDQPLCWIKLEFPLAIPNDYLINHILYPNCIPLVNRRRVEKSVVKSNYDRILLPMPTTDLFLDIERIQDTKNKEDEPESAYQRVDFLHPDSRPGTFMLRSGSRVRRLNREDASRRIHRLMEVIQDEYSTFKEEGVNRLREDFDVIEKAINRIKSQLPDYFRSDENKSSYFCIANFRPRASRLYYFYWETQGELIRHLGDKVRLTVSSGDVNIDKSISVIPIQKGKGELTSDDYLNQLKVSLLSRGRILTRGDIELYCKNRYGNLIQVVSIERALMALVDGKRGRGILVTIEFMASFTAEEKEYIRIEVQNDLNARSAFFTQIKVAVQG